MSNRSDFGHCLKSEQFGSDLGRLADQLNQNRTFSFWMFWLVYTILNINKKIYIKRSSLVKNELNKKMNRTAGMSEI